MDRGTLIKVEINDLMINSYQDLDQYVEYNL